MTARTNLALDLGITAAFLVVSNPPLTGMAVHEWLGVSFGTAALVHVLFHWQWVTGVATRLFGRLKQGARLDFIVDVVLFVTFTAAVLSGVMISKHILPLFGLAASAGRDWRGIHELAANLSVAAVAVHVGLHWTWIVTHTRALFRRGAAAAPVDALSPVGDGVRA